MSLSHDSADRLDVRGADESATADPSDPRVRRFRAPTIEAALEAARAELGPDVEVVAAHRIRRGGVGGFFATDLGVELMVLPPADHDRTADVGPLGLLGEGGFHDDRLPERRLFPAATGRPSIVSVPDGSPGSTVLDRLLESVTRAELLANGQQPTGPATFADHLAHHLAGSHHGPLPIDPTPPGSTATDRPVPIERPIETPIDGPVRRPVGTDEPEDRVRDEPRDAGRAADDRDLEAFESSQRLARLRRAAERCRDAGPTAAVPTTSPTAAMPPASHPEPDERSARPAAPRTVPHVELDDDLDDGLDEELDDDDPRLRELGAGLHALRAAAERDPVAVEPLPVRRSEARRDATADPMELAAGAIGRLVEQLNQVAPRPGSRMEALTRVRVSVTAADGTVVELSADIGGATDG